MMRWWDSLTPQRNPIRCHIEKYDMLNRVNVNWTLMNTDELKEERVVKFEELLAIAEKYKRRNHWK